LLSITIRHRNGGTYDKKSKVLILRQIGGIIKPMIRASDVGCRYGSDHIMIMLPFTGIDDAKILETRMNEVLQTHDFEVGPKPEFSSSAVSCKEKETAEACVQKARELCCPDR
jgi:GGDEF domain-containing protein